MGAWTGAKLNPFLDALFSPNAPRGSTAALGIASDEVANYVFPKTWPANREQRARVIGEWLKAEARFLIAPSINPE